MKNKNLGMAAISVMIAAAAGIWFWAADAQALKYPHNKSYIANPVGCAGCHQTAAIFRSITALNDSMCLKQCHNDTGKAGYKEFGNKYRSNRFNSVSNYSSTRPVSHGWKIPNTNANAGATVGWQPTAEFSGWPPLSGRIYCSRCHRAHGDMVNVTIYGSFLKGDPKGDQICFNCHEARRISNVRDAKASNKHYSHPVEVNYSTARANKPDFFKAWPENPYPTNPSAALRLYTAATGTKNAVLCKTCHGPMHAADSNPYTFDSLTTYGRTGNYSSNAGNLLRRYPMSKSNDICTSCHKVETHQTATKCFDCHTPHKGPGDNNIYLIRTSIMTPYGKRSVQFISTSMMAQRYGIYSGPTIASRSNKICQVCHRTKMYHRAYSTAGARRDHNYLGNGKYRNCSGCHSHASVSAGGGFGGACGACHMYPPDDAYGKHSKHLGGGGYNWTEGTHQDARSAGSYGFSCGRCHNPWVPYTSSIVNAVRHAGPIPGTLKIYTADIGFKNGSPLPANNYSDAGYTYSVGGAQDSGASGSDYYDFRGADSAPTGNEATCRNLYCHGQFYNGYTSNNPVWNGSGAVQACGACHGAKRSTPPGKTGGSANNWGAHPRHVGNANSQQYGFSGWKFGCNACHYPTTMTSVTSIDDRSKHVDGRVTLEFEGGGYGEASSKYDGFVEYTSRKPAFTNPFSNSKPAYKSCGLIYCHSDGSRMSNYSAPFNAGMGTSSAKFPNWSSTKNFTTTINYGGKTFKRRCSRCHGNSTYAGITAAMPGVTSKGNSHVKHVIVNGIMCNICHSNTVNVDSKSIASTSLHVNKIYDVSIDSKYGGTYDNSAKRCSGVDCHGGRLTAMWGDAGRCQDCHFNNTAEAASDKGFADNYQWRNMTTTASVPRIYSSEWTKFGHGRDSASHYPSSGTSGANRVCNDCHKASGTVSHQGAVTGNTFRLFTAPAHLDDLCLECHGTGYSKSGLATKKVLGHNQAAMAGWGDATWQFMPKCIDCHDPHGERNRYMIKAYLNFSGSGTGSGYSATDGKRWYDQNPSVQMVYTTVANGQMNWSSYVKADYSGICQRCHNTQTTMNNFNKEDKSGGGYNASHNSGARCTNCHRHDSGFKGTACDGCHYFPPTLSGKHSFHVATTVSSAYVAYDINNSKTKYAYGCGKCHNSGSHYAGAGGNYTTEVVFDASNSYPRNASGSYVFGARSSIDEGTDGPGGYKWTSTKGTCRNTYCHGQFSGGYTGNDPNWYNNGADDPQNCGKCHGASQASPPSGGAHNKHVAFMAYECRKCHGDTVDPGVNTPPIKDKTVHVNGKTNWRMYTGVGLQADYNKYKFGRATTETTSPTYGYCRNVYCHSRGTDTSNPYDPVEEDGSFPNYTANWNNNLATMFANPGERCSYCHGSRGLGGYRGITSAMPSYDTYMPKINSHKKHVVDNGFSCYVCHAATVSADGRTIANAMNHANKIYDIAFPSAYNAGGASYSGNRCSNITCHGGRTTPEWGSSAVCSDCHYASNGASSAEDSFSWQNWSGTGGNRAARIYSSEWADRGHGRSTAYTYSGNNGASKNCGDCHLDAVKHNQSNYFRIITANGNGSADPDKFCLRCHGSGSQLQTGYGNKTGIQTHSWANVSTAGYKQGNTNGKAGWNFTPKCVDCHDPHGDYKNAFMIHRYINMTGSDSAGRPSSGASAFISFSGMGGAQLRWSSYVKSNNTGICQRCHSGEVSNFNKGLFTAHNTGQMCLNCHKHKKGFAPSGCSGCHGDDTKLYDRSKNSPPKGPMGWSDSLTNSSSLHLPHAYNPKKRPGFNNQTGFACEYCHADTVPAGNHNSAKIAANMNNLTSTTGWNGRDRQSKINFGGDKRPADDTCWSTTCHTPRGYTRTWQKVKDCDDCHGYKRSVSGSIFNVQTTQSHKVHTNYTGSTNLPASWKKNYNFACKNCHYDWVTNNNYSTHYNSFVNITANGPINTIANMKTKDGQFYASRGRSFKGYTTGNETLGTCSKSYCHGNFANGTALTPPNWKKGVTAVNCGSCHKAKTAKVSTWQNGTTMPERHPRHVRTATYSMTCVRCHERTVSNNTTVIFNYSSHVNTRKDVYFDNQGGMDNTGGTYEISNRQCQSIYCHSRGTTTTPSFTVANYTADWDVTATGRTGGRPCSFCHGNKSYGGITAAMPIQSGQAHEKHARNTSGDSFRCGVCHANVVNMAGTIISYTNHINAFKNISVISTYKAGATNYNPAGTKKCDNIRCHGGNITPAWSDTASCLDCHKGTADSNKRMSLNNIFQGYSESVQKVNTGQWLTRGHGRPAARGNYPVSGNTAANKTCTDCHGTGAAGATKADTKHGASTNPFRLITAPDRPNTLCNRCHGAGASGSSLTGILTHASSVTAGGGNGYSFWMKCVDCHDPHGDNNIQMVHSTIARPSALLTKKESSNNYGQSFLNATGRKVDFVNDIYTSDYGKKTTASKICQVCHTQTSQLGVPGNSRYRWNGSTDGTHGTSKCTACHGHSIGFKGAACDSCHGNPPTSKQNMMTSSLNLLKRPFSGTTSAGGHSRHIAIFGGSSNTCGYCHQGGMYNTGAENDNIDIGFKAFSLYTGRYTGKSGVRIGYYGYSGAGITTGNTAKCQVMCHGSGVTGGWLTASYGTLSTPTWENNKRTATCGRCHGSKKASGTGSWPTTGKHVLHAGYGSGRFDIMCKVCHDNTVQGTATTLNNSFHVNAVANVAFGTDDPRTNASSSYIDSNSQVNQAVDGICINNYCHSKGTDSDLAAPYDIAADYANWTASWNDTRGGYNAAQPSRAKCNYCHGNKSYRGTTSAMPNYGNGSPKANVHQKHVATYGFLCNACHVQVAKNNTSISNSGNHVNRAYNINYTTVRGVVRNNGGSYNTTGSRCWNIYCHSRGTSTMSPYTSRLAYPNYTAKWGDNLAAIFTNSGERCSYCHGSKSYKGITAAMPNQANQAHAKHVLGGISCNICHAKTVNAANGIVSITNHLNVFKDISVPRAYKTGQTLYSTTVPAKKTCKNIKCHGSKTTPAWSATGILCQNCHLISSGAVGQEDSFTWQSYSGAVAKIYSTEWMERGHGRTSAYKYSNNNGAGKTCLVCHDSAVNHNDGGNYFRLKNDPETLCLSCHGSAGQLTTGYGNKTGIQSHSWSNVSTAGYKNKLYQNTGGKAGWNFTPKCVDCHDPHGDAKNAYMMHSYVNMTGSDSNGRPTSETTAFMSFSGYRGGAQISWSSYVKSNNQGICQRCHTNQSQMSNFNKGTYNAAHDTQDKDKCPTCHKHKKGFAPIESPGGISCDSPCHSKLFDPMKGDLISYHHVIENASTTYKTGSNVTANDSRKRCLECHVDHDIFRPDLNPSNTKGRAANLRMSIDTVPTTASGYSNRDFEAGDPKGGICTSCHSVPQARNTDDQIKDDSQFNLRINIDYFKTTPHNYTVAYKVKSDGSRFLSNCLKCHNDALAKDRWNNSTGLGLHKSRVRRLHAEINMKVYNGTATGASTTTLQQRGANWPTNYYEDKSVTITGGIGSIQSADVLSNTTSTLKLRKPWTKTTPIAGSSFVIGDPPNEDFCYNCHSLQSNPNAVNGKDVYGVATYQNTKALKMEQTFDGVNGFPRAAGTTTTIRRANNTENDPVVWKVNQWVGWPVKILSGTNRNRSRTVLSNTTSTATVSVAWPSASSTTSQYAIGNPFRHRIQLFTGQHHSDEAISAPGTQTAFGWFTAIGTKTHVSCMDCHNPHTQKKPGAEQGKSDKTFSTSSTINDTGAVSGVKNWVTDQWRGYNLVAIDRSQAGDERMIVANTASRLRVAPPFDARMTGIYYNILPRGRAYVSQDQFKGNSLNGPANGSWGVNVVRFGKARPSSTIGFDNLSAPVFSKITTLISGQHKVYNLCWKCHSTYGWGTQGTPYKIMDGKALATKGSFSNGTSTDTSKEFNPNNLAHHALVEPGKNQPIAPNYGYTNISSYYNTSWPAWKGSATRRLRMTTGGHANVNQAMPETVIPGWYLYVGSTLPNGKTGGKANVGATTPYYKGWLQISRIVNYTSFDVNLAATPPIQPAITIPAAFSNRSGFAITAGLGNNFVPPYGPWSVIMCPDCHDTDSPDDPSGPHGSGRNWMMRKMEAQRFRWMNSSGFVRTIGWGPENTTDDGVGWASSYSSNTMCLNCHRADVYGNDQQAAAGNQYNETIPTGANFVNFRWREDMSRVPHPADGNDDNSAYRASYNTFRVVCMNCHGGAGFGDLHGSNMGKSRDDGGAITPASASYRGKRLLNGGGWTGLVRPTTTSAGMCYVRSTTTVIPTAINSCNDGTSQAMSFMATYDYDGGVDY